MAQSDELCKYYMEGNEICRYKCIYERKKLISCLKLTFTYVCTYTYVCR